MALCSMSDDNLDFYEIDFSYRDWLRPVTNHDWVYQGRVCEVLGGGFAVIGGYAAVPALMLFVSCWVRLRMAMPSATMTTR